MSKQPAANGWYYPLSAEEAGPADAFVYDHHENQTRYVMFVVDIAGGSDVEPGHWGYQVEILYGIPNDPGGHVSVADRTLGGTFSEGSVKDRKALTSWKALNAFAKFQKLIVTTPPYGQ